MARPYLFVTRGDLARLRADVVILPTSSAAEGDGETISAARTCWNLDFTPLLAAAKEAFAGAAGRAHGAPLTSMDAPGLPGGVVLVSTIHHTVAPSDIRAAAGAALREARRLVTTLDRQPAYQRRGPDGNRALIAIGAFASGAAGGEQHRELAKAQLHGICDGLEAGEGAADVDVVLVAWTEDQRATFVGARRALGEEARAALELEGMPAVTAAEAHIATAIRRESCVLFVGAGLSRGAGLPDWRALIQRMSTSPHVEPRLRALRERRQGSTAGEVRYRADDYLDIAEWYAAPARDHLALVGELFSEQATRDSPVTALHYLLLQLPFRYVVTTNFDSLVEQALEALRRPHRRVTADTEVAHAGLKGQSTVFKIHGHATERGGEDIVLTRTEFARFHHDHRAKAALLQGLLLNHHFLFVGYGLGDPNLNTIREAVQAMLADHQRCAWATSIGPTTQSAGSDALAWLGYADPRAMWIAFDRIAAQCIESARGYLADRTVPRPSPLRDSAGALGAALVSTIDTLERARDRSAAAQELAPAAALLDALAALGWRPASGSRFALWAKLAALSADDAVFALELWSRALADAANEEERRVASGMLATLDVELQRQRQGSTTA